MSRKVPWTLSVTPGLAVAIWLSAFFLLSGSTVGATPDDLAVIPGTSVALETRAIVANSSVSSDSLYPCRGVWATQTVESAGDVGQRTSLALEPAYPYTPHISYWDVANNHLRYAWLSGATWYTETVGSGGDSTSIALVPTYPYTPCIAYQDWSTWFLWYACREGTAWRIIAVSSMRANSPSLALEPVHPYTPHITYNNPWNAPPFRALFHTYLSGTTWFSGTWVHEPVEAPLSDTGSGSSLALEPTYPYTPHVSYWDYPNRDLKYTRKSGTVWLTETVDSEGDVGMSSSLALDRNGNPHISYLDNTHGALKYACLSDTAWFSETVDSTGWTYPKGGTSLELDQADNPHICYYDALDADLKLAYSDGAAWMIQTVDSKGDVGAFCSLALDPLGCPHISYYDATNGDLKYAYVSPIKAYLPLVMRGYSQAPPDLIVESIETSPIEPIEGQEALITITVRNQGQTAAEPFQCDWYVNPESPPDVGDIGTDSWEVGSLGPNASADLTTTYVFTPTGDYSLSAQVDTFDVVPEADEENNVAERMTSVAAQPRPLEEIARGIRLRTILWNTLFGVCDDPNDDLAFYEAEAFLDHELVNYIVTEYAYDYNSVGKIVGYTAWVHDDGPGGSPHSFKHHLQSGHPLALSYSGTFTSSLYSSSVYTATQSSLRPPISYTVIRDYGNGEAYQIELTDLKFSGISGNSPPLLSYVATVYGEAYAGATISVNQIWSRDLWNPLYCVR